MKRVLVACSGEESAVAVLNDRGLVDLTPGPDDDAQIIGNIYRGRVVSVDTRIQAAFVDVGLDFEAFLHVSNVHHAYGDGEGGRPSIDQLLDVGREVLVQLSRDPHRVNDFVLSTMISLPGRYLVLMPGNRKLGVSKKIVDTTERKRLLQILKDLDPPDDLGYVLRTEGVGCSAELIGADLQYLLLEWRRVLERVRSSESPALVYAEHDYVFKALRGVLEDGDIDELIIDDEQLYDRARDFVKVLTPGFRGQVKLHKDERPLLQSFGISSLSP